MLLSPSYCQLLTSPPPASAYWRTINRVDTGYMNNNTLHSHTCYCRRLPHQHRRVCACCVDGDLRYKFRPHCILFLFLHPDHQISSQPPELHLITQNNKTPPTLHCRRPFNVEQHSPSHALPRQYASARPPDASITCVRRPRQGVAGTAGDHFHSRIRPSFRSSAHPGLDARAIR